MVLSLIALTLGFQDGLPAMPAKGFICPVTGEAVPAKPAALVDFNGVRYGMCCGGCDSGMKENPAKVLADPKLKGKLVGFSLFDPITGLRIEPKKAASFADYKGVRYYFAVASEKASFTAAPKKFTAAPKMETLTCPGSGEKIAGYASAGGYLDVDGTRVYVCCPDCYAAAKKDPAAFLKKAKDLQKPVAANGK